MKLSYIIVWNVFSEPLTSQRGRGRSTIVTTLIRCSLVNYIIISVEERQLTFKKRQQKLNLNPFVSIIRRTLAKKRFHRCLFVNYSFSCSSTESIDSHSRSSTENPPFTIPFYNPLYQPSFIFNFNKLLLLPVSMTPVIVNYLLNTTRHWINQVTEVFSLQGLPLLRKSFIDLTSD